MCRSCDHRAILFRDLPAIASTWHPGFGGSMIDVKPDKAKQNLTDLLGELASLRSTDSTEFVSWNSRVRSTLTHALGEQHHITRQFVRIMWSSPIGGGDHSSWFRDGANEARGLLDAAISELGMLDDEVPVADESGIDAELWEHVAPEIRSEAWGKAARGAVVFTEDRIRKWTGRPTHEVSDKLALAVFGTNGSYRLGLTDSEKQGWQFIAQGIAQALRNVETHRIQDRPDHKRYALGVVGACSLLLTQLRFQHGNSFHDISPATSTEADNSNQ
jgi:hypothetical protein